MRHFAPGQEVEIRTEGHGRRYGRIIALGCQDVLPLYWIEIDGTSEEVLRFEHELRQRAAERDNVPATDVRQAQTISMS